ncbi:MAG: hypothetical protein NTZ73_04510 [Candidatus Diapherotrites archaeon]|nr:hypothetical protein [Candidatus Diapherotrites archaeon]
MQKKFVKICSKCRSENIKQRLPQITNSWICNNCGNTNFSPIEIKKGK